MFGSDFKQRVLATISGWFCALLVTTLLIHPFGLSAEERLWQSDDVSYGSPISVPDLLATPAQNQEVGNILADSFSAAPPTRINLLPPEKTATGPRWIDTAVPPRIALLTAPFLPRPPPVPLHHSRIA